MPATQARDQRHLPIASTSAIIVLTAGVSVLLHASGATGNYRVALYRYNPVPEYVDAVMRYARQKTRDPRTFYAYYNWQVFVLTKHGLVRLTGPSLSASSRGRTLRQQSFGRSPRGPVRGMPTLGLRETVYELLHAWELSFEEGLQRAVEVLGPLLIAR